MHSIPICKPHLDRYKRPVRRYKTVKVRPIPDSAKRKFGKWIVSEHWDVVLLESSPTLQASKLEKLLMSKLDEFCPVREHKLSTHDKPFITSDLKQLHRRKSREYNKRGKTEKYKILVKQFKEKYRLEAKKYIEKSVNELKVANPGKAFSVLKRLGAQPGNDAATGFVLPSHENLSTKESAEK